MASDQSEPTPLEAVSPEPSPHVVDVIGPSSNNDITVATTVVPPEDNTETKTEEPHAETVSEAPQAPNHNLSPLLPLNLVQHKRHSSTHSGYIANVVQGEQKTLRIEPVNSSVQAGPENAPAPAPPPASNIYLSSAFQSSIRNRSGDEFTLVLKYRFAAQDSAQKELWLHYFAALGLVASNEDDESTSTPKREREGKRKHGTLKKSRTESSDSSLSPRDSPSKLHGDRESRARPKSAGKYSLEAYAAADTPSPSHPKSPKSKRFSKEESSPRSGSQRREISPSSPHASSFGGTSSPLSDSLSPRDEFSSPRGSAEVDPVLLQSPPVVVPELPPLEPELPSNTPRLIRVHGARNNIHCSLVPRQASSLNKNDCFVLDDAVGTLYVWKGKSANMFAKSECSDVALAISQASYGGKAKMINIQQGIESAEFWALLTNGKGDIAEADTTGVTAVARLLKLPVDSATPTTTGSAIQIEEGRTQLSPGLLRDSAIYALDTGFEIVVLDSLKDQPEPLPDQLLIDAARRYKQERKRPIEVRISVVRNNPRHPLIAHFIK